MELTFIGYAQIVLGAMVVIAGNMRHALVFLMVSALFNGSAALLLPSLGGSSIPPIQLALAFVFVRILMPGSAAIGDLPEAFKANRWFALFSVYGIVTAFVLPRMFAGSVSVYPMRYDLPGDLFAAVPLVPTSQNLTAAFYLLGAFLAALAVWIACRRKNAAGLLITTLVVMAWLHAVSGLVGVAARGTPVDLALELFRNSAYVQMDDEVGGFVRIRGIFPEASAYAALGFILFVANSEMWFHSVRSRATGLGNVGDGGGAVFQHLVDGLFWIGDLQPVLCPADDSAAEFGKFCQGESRHRRHRVASLPSGVGVHGVASIGGIGCRCRQTHDDREIVERVRAAKAVLDAAGLGVVPCLIRPRGRIGQFPLIEYFRCYAGFDGHHRDRFLSDLCRSDISALASVQLDGIACAAGKSGRCVGQRCLAQPDSRCGEFGYRSSGGELRDTGQCIAGVQAL